MATRRTKSTAKKTPAKARKPAGGQANRTARKTTAARDTRRGTPPAARKRATGSRKATSAAAPRKSRVLKAAIPESPVTPPARTWTEGDRNALAWAFDKLEHPSFAARLSSVLGTPIEAGVKLLPKQWSRRIFDSAHSAVQRTVTLAVSTLPATGAVPSSDRLHQAACIGTGAAGGFFGLPGLLFDLPVSTLIMLRSIADIGRSLGEDLSSLESRLACVEVFAFGGRSPEDDAAETGYYELRLAMALNFSALPAALLTGRSVADAGMLGLTRTVASRFGVAISDKVAAQLAPFVGAAAGATINAVFIQHFQNMARAHFLVRRLERHYGTERVQEAYEELRPQPTRVLNITPRQPVTTVGAAA